MGTKRPLGSISFNTAEYLSSVCKSLVSDGLVGSYAFIRHYGEDDTKKDHFHLLLVPASPVDPNKIRKRFVEPCSDGDLICLPFQPSKLSDWVLYALHYPPYLIKKGLSRQYHYNVPDIQSNEPIEWLEDIFHSACEDLTDKRISKFIDRINLGDSFGDILASGLVPYNQVIFYDKLYHSYTPMHCELDETHFEKINGRFRKVVSPSLPEI